MKNIFIVIVLCFLLSCSPAKSIESCVSVVYPTESKRSFFDVPKPLIGLGALAALPLLMLIYHFIPKSLKDANSNHI